MAERSPWRQSFLQPPSLPPSPGLVLARVTVPLSAPHVHPRQPFRRGISLPPCSAPRPLGAFPVTPHWGTHPLYAPRPGISSSVGQNALSGGSGTGAQEDAVTSHPGPGASIPEPVHWVVWGKSCSHLATIFISTTLLQDKRDQHPSGTGTDNSSYFLAFAMYQILSALRPSSCLIVPDCGPSWSLLPPNSACTQQPWR